MQSSDPPGRFPPNKEGPPWFLFWLVFLAFFLPTAADLQYSLVWNDLEIREEAAGWIEQGVSTRRIRISFLGVLSALSIIWNRRSVPIPNSWLSAFFVASGFWIFSSLLWTDRLDLSIRRLIVTLAVLLGSWAFLSSTSIRRLAGCTAIWTGVTVAVGFVAEIYLGTFQPLVLSYRFAGTLHPNVQGFNCGMLIISSLTAARMFERRGNFFRALFCLGFVALVLTKSRTAVLTILFSLIVCEVFISRRSVALRNFFVIAFILSSLAMIIGPAVVPTLENVFLLGRAGEGANTLLSRTELWSECLTFAEQRMVQGYGFGAFWTAENIYRISRSVGWTVSNAHSFFVDVLLETGLIGLFFLVGMFFLSIVRALRSIRFQGDLSNGFLFTMLVWFFLHSFLESAVYAGGYGQFLFLLMILKVGFVQKGGMGDQTARTRTARGENS